MSESVTSPVGDEPTVKPAPVLTVMATAAPSALKSASVAPTAIVIELSVGSFTFAVVLSARKRALAMETPFHVAKADRIAATGLLPGEITVTAEPEAPLCRPAAI